MKAVGCCIIASVTSCYSFGIGTLRQGAYPNAPKQDLGFSVLQSLCGSLLCRDNTPMPYAALHCNALICTLFTALHCSDLHRAARSSWSHWL